MARPEDAPLFADRMARDVTANYTLVPDDQYYFLICNSEQPITVTVPAKPVLTGGQGTLYYVWRYGSGSVNLRFDAGLLPQWAAHIAIQDAADEGVDVVAFLKSVDQPGWVAFEITSCGMACGPVSSTTWTVLDLG
jgi:hypothetical protein